MPHDLRERITQELKHRGGWSIRKAAEEAAVKAAELGERAASNATLSRYMAGGELTPSVRRTFALAFDWGMDWPEDPPPLPPARELTEGAEDRILKAIAAGAVSWWEPALAALQAIEVRLDRIEQRLGIAMPELEAPRDTGVTEQ